MRGPRENSGAWWEDRRLIDTAPMTSATYLAIVARLEASSEPPDDVDPAALGCLPQPMPAQALVHFADGSRAAYLVKVHCLSARQLGFLHGFPIAADSGCHLALRTTNQQVMIVPGRVAHSADLGQRIYAITVALDQRINPTDFLTARGANDAVVLAVQQPSR